MTTSSYSSSYGTNQHACDIQDQLLPTTTTTPKHNHRTLFHFPKPATRTTTLYTILITLNLFVLCGVGYISIKLSQASNLPPMIATSTLPTTSMNKVAGAGFEVVENRLNVNAVAGLQFPQSLLPSKYAVTHVTPRKDQSQRGTCWDFATIGVLEQSYRAQGVKMGYLNRSEYVAFSEQAYGVQVLKLCTGNEDSLQQVACRVAGDSMWKNSTEGGETPELYYLQHGLANTIFPHSICPYYQHEGHDTECEKLTNSTHYYDTNPLQFQVRAMETKYDDLSIKSHLYQKQMAMTLSTPVTYVTHYYPCIAPFLTESPHCQMETCTVCPPELAMTTCCVPLTGGRNRNMEGEFYSHRGMTIEGGHAMLLVGYNDAFKTREGFTGGLIVKNSWLDGPTQGSHSLNYWMQEISDWEERVICPNSYNPFNWYQCGNDPTPVVAPKTNTTTTTTNTNSNTTNTNAAFNRTNAFTGGINACLSTEAQIYAQLNYQPLHLQCIDSKQCLTDREYTYYVKNTTDYGDKMTVVCLWEHNTAIQNSSTSQSTTRQSDSLSDTNIVYAAPGSARDFCLKPMLEVDIAKTLQPIPSEIIENDTDRCGFYFIPYESIRQYIAQFQGFFVNSFEIEWAPSSYRRNQDQYPMLDYSLVLESTRVQHEDHFVGPFPFAKIVPAQ